MVRDPLHVLMFPGLDGTGHLFAPVLRELPEEFAPQVIRYPADHALGYEELVSYAEALLPRGRRFAMLAESFSGPLVLQMAAKQPPGLVAVVLVASFQRRPISRLLAGVLRPLVGVVFSRPPPAFVARYLLVGLDAPSQLVAELRAATSMVKGDVLAARVRATLNVDATDALAACRVPILYIGGSEDRLLRRGILRDLRAGQPAAEIHVLAAPHLVLQRQPRKAAALISEFLRRVVS
jgi:pimeloyl-ACP methyl ester carboxylesterase